MTLLFVLVGLAVVLAVGLLAVGRLGELPEVEPDRAPDLLPDDGPLDTAAIEGVRFDVGVRGYRMDEVDDLLDRVAVDLATRDERIAALESRLRDAGLVDPVDVAESVDVADPVDVAESVDVADPVDVAESVDVADPVETADQADDADGAPGVAAPDADAAADATRG
ncbi:MAG: DivIVA domain-containing protein [Candidatus Nanopelagicales bacterium]